MLNILYTKNKQTSNPGFTLVELLVVIVVIAILAAITIVSYTGIASKANTAALQSDLANNTQVLKIYYTLNSSYPITLDTNNCPATPVPDTTNCLKLSSTNQLAYSPMDTANPTSPQDFRLTVSDATAKTNYSTNANSLNCPVNFIIVPGSTTYNTTDFCVMKYEAKQVGTTATSISQAAGTPWVNISQTTAIANAPNTKNSDGSNCTTCHLITEAEWMTIAQNVLSVPSNWRDNVVGTASSSTNYIYSGHNDNNPANALAASTNDNDGYYGTGNSSTSGANQRRTLTLTNGEVIWDIAGNVYDWTSGQTAGGQSGIAGEPAYTWKEYTAITAAGTLSTNITPFSTGLAGAGTWDSTNGIGQLHSYSDEVVLRSFLRGGIWYIGSSSGILSLTLGNGPSDKGVRIGFRVAASSGL